MTFNKKYKYLVFVVIVLVFSTSSFAFGAYAVQKNIIKFPVKITKTVEAKTLADTNTDLFFTVWNTLKSKSIHYDEKTDAERMYGAIQGLTASLGDPYTEFMPPNETKQFNDSIKGSFGGIGAEIGKLDDILTVISPLKGSPAEKSGLKSGDKIFKIDGVIASDMSIDQAIAKIRGKAGTIVKLEIYRKGEPASRIIEITRDTVVIPTIETENVNGVFVIHISTFGEKVMYDFANAIEAYKKSGSQYMIIDVRGNPGGYLEAAVDISSYFVPKGKTIVSEDFVKDNKKDIHTSYGYNDLNPKPKVVVLIDGGSASASEILAGALRDNKIAKLIGTKTFGKGSVQELLPMQGGTSLKITIARWLTPNGETIDKQGIKPDIEIKRIYDEKDPKKDNQLEKAIEVVKGN